MRTRSSTSERPAVDPDTVVDLSRRSGDLLRAVIAARAEDGLTSEDLVIYLAVGHLGVDGAGPIPRLTPRTFLDIAGFLGIPRETVRRKLGRLADRGFVEIGPGGVVVRDVAVWLRHVEALVVPVAAAIEAMPRHNARPRGAQL
jgi:CRP-like cAMP-binding protein